VTDTSPRTSLSDTTAQTGTQRAADHPSAETAPRGDGLGHAAVSSNGSAVFMPEAVEGWLYNQKKAQLRGGQGDMNEVSTIYREEQSIPRNLGVVINLGIQSVAPREIKLQEWEGQVERVGRRYFYGRLVDLTTGETEETEEVDFPIDDLTDSDRKLLVPGAVFRWIIGYRYNRGQKDRFSRIVIRRLPIWTSDEIRAADERATKLHEILSRHRNNRAARSNSG
jgi:hypothetical protein